MSLKNKVVFVAFTSALAFLFGCHRHHQRRFLAPGLGQDRVFEVHIYADPSNPTQKCLVDVNAATLWVAKNQSAKWISDDANYVVDFQPGHHGNPFKHATTWYEVSNGNDAPSGKLNGNAGGQYYDYAIYFGTEENHSKEPCKNVSDDPGFYVK